GKPASLMVTPSILRGVVRAPAKIRTPARKRTLHHVTLDARYPKPGSSKLPSPLLPYCVGNGSPSYDVLRAKPNQVGVRSRDVSSLTCRGGNAARNEEGVLLRQVGRQTVGMMR